MRGNPPPLVRVERQIRGEDDFLVALLADEKRSDSGLSRRSRLDATESDSYQHRQPVFQAEFDSPPSPRLQLQVYNNNRKHLATKHLSPYYLGR